MTGGTTTPTTVADPKKKYAQKMGAEFAAGFLYGSRVGGFDEKKLYECLDREAKADELFFNADIELKNAIYKKDAALAVKGLTDMIGFVTDMALEHTANGGAGRKSRGKAQCPELISK